MPERQGDELLVEGIRSYLQALVAISEFRRLVEDKFHRAVDERRDSIAASLKVQIGPDAIQPYCFPDKPGREFRGDWAAIGVRIIPIEVGVCKEHTYYLGWWRDQAGPVAGIFASIRFSERSIAERAMSSLQKTGMAPPELSKTTISQWRKLEFNDIEQLQERIEKLLGEWCEAWRGAGGLPKALRA